MTVSYRPFYPYDGRQAGLWYLPARWRYTTRRVNTLCQGEDGMQHQLALFHGYYNFILPHTSLRQPLPVPVSRPGPHLVRCKGLVKMMVVIQGTTGLVTID